jgi:hypothetical protein
VKTRRSERTTTSDSSSASLSSASIESEPRNSLANALRHACGVVTSSWKRLETDAHAARSLGARCASAWVKISFGSSAIGLRLSIGSLCFFMTSKAGPSLFFGSGGVDACSYSSILFFVVRKGVDGFGETDSTGDGGLSRRSSRLTGRSPSCSEAANAASAASCSADVPALASTCEVLREGSEMPAGSWSGRPCWVGGVGVSGGATGDSGVEAVGSSGCIK